MEHGQVAGPKGARWNSAAMLLALSIAAWAFLVWLMLDMDHPLAMLTMPVTTHWQIANTLMIATMWAVMMAAMMLPTALPMLQTFVQLSLRSGRQRHALVFVLGYLLVWLGFSLAATGLQWSLQAAGWLTPMAVSRSRVLTAVVLVIAGLYQFTPLKRMCLAHCRSPLSFLMGRWRSGVAGAWAMGWWHGLTCLGCCWALMVLLFVGGVMNLAWVVALSLAVAIEKLAPAGERLGELLGMGLIAAGLLKLGILMVAAAG